MNVHSTLYLAFDDLLHCSQICKDIMGINIYYEKKVFVFIFLYKLIYCTHTTLKNTCITFTITISITITTIITVVLIIVFSVLPTCHFT
jgi:hypothetical protein